MSLLRRVNAFMNRNLWTSLIVRTNNINGTQAIQLTDGEKKLITVLEGKFPKALEIQVADISGGCGSMYEISIESEEFKGKRTILQHRMVTEALSDEIKEMHGLKINTQVPKD